MEIPVKECRSCGAQIIWASVKKKDGTTVRMPFDLDPTPDGTHRMFLREYRTDGKLEKTDVRAEWVPPRGRGSAKAPLRVTHFVTCPNAEQHRAGRKP